MDTVRVRRVEAPVVAIVDHEMVVYDGKRKKSIAEGEVAFPGSL